MKVNEDSDSLPTDEDDGLSYVAANFSEVFRPHRDREFLHTAALFPADIELPSSHVFFFFL